MSERKRNRWFNAWKDMPLWMGGLLWCFLLPSLILLYLLSCTELKYLPFPNWENVRNFVWSIGAIYGGFVVLFALYLNGRRTEQLHRQNDLADQGQVTERYTRAVTQLGHTQSAAVRMGGLYALERVAQESKKEKEQSLRVIAGFVRDRAPAPKPEKDEYGRDKIDEEDNLIFEETPIHGERPEIEAAIKILARTAKGKQERESVDLSATDLRGLFLNNLNLSRFDLSRSHISDSRLMHSNLSHTLLVSSILIRTDFSNANLSNVNLDWANIKDTNFRATVLSKAFLVDAKGAAQNQFRSIKYKKSKPPSLPDTNDEPTQIPERPFNIIEDDEE